MRIQHLSVYHRRLLGTIVDTIVRAVRPEKIVLFGLYARSDKQSEERREIPPLRNAFDLLVVKRQKDARESYVLQDLIENVCRQHAPVTAVVHDIGYINRQRAAGQPFFAMLLNQGILLYDDDRTPFFNLAKVPDWGRVYRQAAFDYNRWHGQAKGFYDAAAFSISKGNDRIALFLLHQSLENLYQAILLCHMGYKPTTHNLDKLRRYTNRFSPDLAMVFPRNGDLEDELFRKLIAGYVDARYHEEFQATDGVLDELANRVGRALEVGSTICAEQLVNLEKRKTIADV